MKTLSERQKEAMDVPPKKTQVALARACGVKPPSVNDWVSGKSQTIEGKNLLRAAAFLKVSPAWLAAGVGPMRADAQQQPIEPGVDRFPIRRGLFKLSAGVSGYEVEYENGESEPIFMAKRWFDLNHYNAERLIALKVTGRSMEPKMHDGDLVIVNTDSHKPVDGVVFAVNYEGEMVIKRMKRDAGQWFIASDNPDKNRYGDKVCAEACFLLGEVVYLQTENI